MHKALDLNLNPDSRKERGRDRRKVLRHAPVRRSQMLIMTHDALVHPGALPFPS